MKSVYDWSIKTKISVIVILSCTLAIATGFVYFIVYEIDMIKEEMVKNIFMQLQFMETQYFAAALDFDTLDADDAVKILGGNPMIVSARLYKEKEEKPYVAYPSPNAIDIPPLDLFGKEKNHQFTKDYLQVVKAIPYDMAQKSAIFEVVYDLGDLKKRIRNILLTTVFALVLSLLIAYLLEMRLMRWITQPVSRLSETAIKISQDRNYSLRAQKLGNDEIGHFVDVFNGMLEQIQKQDVELRTARDELEDRVQRRTSELKKANEQLLELDRMKSVFVSQASHDLRTPLTTIKLNLDNLMRGVGGSLSDKQKSVLDRAQGAVNRLTHLINDVLDLNRIESGRMILEKVNAPFDALVHNVIKENQSAADQKRIALRAQIMQGEYHVNIDAGKMERVVGELIGNAIKYTPEGGRVDVEVKRGDGGRIILSVADTGIGMTEKESDKIWERFYRTVSSQKVAVGSGLGLSIAKELTQMHGGSLAVKSEPGKGSVFTLALPTLTS
ncbi:MAG: HAMP domain-containing sensor histidine kinase [Candidatus Omnitrophota bacterium]